METIWNNWFLQETLETVHKDVVLEKIRKRKMSIIEEQRTRPLLHLIFNIVY